MRYPRLRLLTPVVVGLFVARLLMEQSGLLISLPVAIGVGALAVYILIARPIRRLRDKVPWWIALLAIYILWPEYAPDLGIVLGTLVILILLMHQDFARRPWLWDIAIFVVALVIYTRTLSPGVLPADSGELQKVSAVLGVAHPPGYPLYTIITHLFTLLPINNLAWRTNLFSALTSAATLATVSATVSLLPFPSLRGEGAGG